MYGKRRADDLAAECLPDRLMAEADAEDRNARRRCRDQIKANAGLVRRAGPWREHDRVGLCRNDGARRHLVVTMHFDLGPELTEIVDEVEGKAVVIVDQDDHGRTGRSRIPALLDTRAHNG